MATFFPTAAAFRAWLRANAAGEPELVVGFHKLGSGRPSITWPEAVDEALCVGWIDGVRKRIDGDSYQIRFTPRKPASTWSAVNVARVRALEAEGRMTPPGREAYSRRREERSGTYSYEQPAGVELGDAAAAEFRSNPAAWAFFEAQPPGYRKKVIWWVAGAKQAVTRQTRLARLIAASAAGRRL